jgi:hypothetical protein
LQIYSGLPRRKAARNDSSLDSRLRGNDGESDNETKQNFLILYFTVWFSELLCFARNDGAEILRIICSSLRK